MVSSRFVGIFDIDQSINKSLEDIGRLRKASRAYLFLFDKEKKLMDNTHEWCNDSVSPQIANLKNIPFRSLPWLMAKLKKGEVVQVEDVSSLPEEAGAEKKEFEKENIKSILILPLYVAGELLGFVGFDNVMETGKWRDYDLALLHMLSEIIGNALERDLTEDLILHAKQDWEETFDAITDIITVHDKDFNIVRANKAAWEMLKLPDMGINKALKCYSYFHGRDCAPEGCPSCACYNTGKPATFELFEPHLNAFIEIRAIPQFDASNQFTGLIHVARDISQRKKIEEEIKKRVEDLEKFYEMAVGRELRIKDLKREIKRLNEELLKSTDKIKKKENT